MIHMDTKITQDSNNIININHTSKINKTVAYFSTVSCLWYNAIKHTNTNEDTKILK